MAKSKAEFEERVVVEMNPVAPDVRVRVREEGDGKISNGVHGPGGDELYEEGEEFVINEITAKELKKRYFVDILGPVELQAATEKAKA